MCMQMVALLAGCGTERRMRQRQLDRGNSGYAILSAFAILVQ